MEMMLSGRIAIVTGAAKGIGKGIALKFSEQGATVALVGRNLAALQQVEKLIQKNGGTALCVTADVCDIKQVKALTSTVIEQCGRVDILVNHPGFSNAIPSRVMPTEPFYDFLPPPLPPSSRIPPRRPET